MVEELLHIHYGLHCTDMVAKMGGKRFRDFIRSYSEKPSDEEVFESFTKVFKVQH